MAAKPLMQASLVEDPKFPDGAARVQINIEIDKVMSATDAEKVMRFLRNVLNVLSRLELRVKGTKQKPGRIV